MGPKRLRFNSRPDVHVKKKKTCLHFKGDLYAESHSDDKSIFPTIDKPDTAFQFSRYSSPVLEKKSSHAMFFSSPGQPQHLVGGTRSRDLSVTTACFRTRTPPARDLDSQIRRIRPWIIYNVHQWRFSTVHQHCIAGMFPFKEVKSRGEAAKIFF